MYIYIYIYIYITQFREPSEYVFYSFYAGGVMYIYIYIYIYIFPLLIAYFRPVAKEKPEVGDMERKLFTPLQYANTHNNI